MVMLTESIKAIQRRGLKIRSLWYFVHWFLGTGVSIVAIINIYIGLHGYQTKTSRSTRTWSILFTVEIAILAFVYLFQDRYDYMKKQGVILGNEQVAPQMSPRTTLKEFIMNC
ncbi:hypothetical protein QJS10_CPA03g00636 [Acorus calamus]|uniref:Cytochrome b561 domain-containing protein n=1 Tax=Acorus calamus TaxID=4465 RepID=A0AAV9F7C7_ACOCL|nr:hypothetical protein QJS10_CPA03g00636 [Acorus calamus]